MFLIKITQFLHVWSDCFSAMKKLRLFFPFLIFAIIQFLGLVVLLNYYNFPFDNLFVPIISRFFGENLLHYPDIFIIIPFLFSNINILLGGFLGIIFIGIATIMFAKTFQEKDDQKSLSFRQVLSKYAVLFVLWLIQSIFVLSAIIGVPILFRDLLEIGYSEMRFVQLFCFMLGLFLSSIFAYSTAAVVLDNFKIKKALAKSADIFVKNIVFTFLFVAIPNLIIFPLNYIANKTQFLILKFNPEVIIVLLSITIIVSIFTNFILIGSLTKFYIVQKTT